MKKILKKEKIELLDDDKTKNSKAITKNIFLIISIVLLLITLGISGYLYYQNTKIENDVNKSKDSIIKVKEKIDSDKKELDEKEDEYEKLKENVKEQVEELNIWEETREKLKQSLS